MCLGMKKIVSIYLIVLVLSILFIVNQKTTTLGNNSPK